MGSGPLFHLSEQTPQDKTEAGERIKADSTNFLALKGMSLYKVTLEPNGVREPHWHQNADELGYCLQGEALVTFYHTADLKETFLVTAGDVFLIPSGALHYISNVGKDKLLLLLQFSNDNPEEFSLSSTINAFSNAVLGNTWGVEKEVFTAFKRPLKDSFARLIKKVEPIPEQARYSNPYRYSLEASSPILETVGGSAKMARQNTWAVLKKQALYSLRLTKQGMREPHWHPETSEMGYVHKGKGRMTLLHPSGAIDTYELKEGDLYYIPKAYPHHIETISDTPLHFLIFFDQAMPKDIGFTGSIKAFSNEVLGTFLDVEPQFFDHLHKYFSDLFIVDKINPLD
jgi:oxalate decarboxylase